MFKIRNTGITDKRGFSHTCYVATATKKLKDFHNFSLWTTYQEAKILFWLLDDFWPDCVALSLCGNCVDNEQDELKQNTYSQIRHVDPIVVYC